MEPEPPTAAAHVRSPLLASDSAPEPALLLACLATQPESADVETIPGIAGGVTARLAAVLRGHFALVDRSQGSQPLLITSASATDAHVGGRYDVLWWEPATLSPPASPASSFRLLAGGAWRVHRDARVRLCERDYLARNADLYGPGAPFGDSQPSSGHHALVDPRVVRTLHGKPGFDHNTFWTAACWLVATGSSGSARWDAEYHALAAVAARYAVPLVRQCNACFRRTALDAATGAHAPLQACGRCGVAYYCGRECQLHDWRACGHKQKCAGAGAGGAAAAAAGESKG